MAERGNLVRRVEQLRELGAKTRKRYRQKNFDSDENLSTAAEITELPLQKPTSETSNLTVKLNNF